MEWKEKYRIKEIAIKIVIPTAAIFLCVVIFGTLLGCGKGKQKEGDVSEGGEVSTEIADGEGKDPQEELIGGEASEEGADVEIVELLSANTVQETDALSYGVDVAKYQGTIDWKQVADAGVTFAMIRVGFRTLDTGEIVADSNARYNMQEASANGIQIGAYFFSTAISEEEAREEADWVSDFISQYKITYPVAYNCEGFERAENRQYGLNKEERTVIAVAFLERIYENGYTPMFYAARNELMGNAKWDTGILEKRYKIWVAQYPTIVDKVVPDYDGHYAMWQYTNMGSVPGIPKAVDLNMAYFGYDGTEEAKNSEAPEDAKADPEALMKFTEVEEEVTAKDSTNLRSIPSQGEDSMIVYTLKNGETVTRTGVSDSGWSRVVYDGQILYAVSNYLTTDLAVKVPEPDDGIKTPFTPWSDVVTAKIEVNLRTLPSVTNPESLVVVTLKNGEYVVRTGINTDYGWSRVDYNGQTLYCVSSYLMVVE